MIPTEIPECIQQDPISQFGFARLRALAAEQRITVHVLLGLHGSAEHFDEILNRHREILSQAPIIAIEADWTATPNSDGQFRDPAPVVTGDPGRQEFTTHQLTWLRDQAKTVLPCDIDGPEDPLRQALKYFWNLTETDFSVGDPPLSFKQQEIIASGVYQNIREWMMIGQLGYWLDQLANRQQLPTGRCAIPFIVGSWHLPMVDKFTACGIPAVNYPDPEPISEYGELFVSMVSTASATLPEHPISPWD